MTKTSIGVQELRKRIGEKAKADPHHRFWGLYTHVWKLDTLEEAYRLAKENHGAPGVDGVTFAQIEAQGREKLLETLSQELREKSYRPLPCRQVEIPKEGGKVRTLKIPIPAANYSNVQKSALGNGHDHPADPSAGRP